MGLAPHPRRETIPKKKMAPKKNLRLIRSKRQLTIIRMQRERVLPMEGVIEKEVYYYPILYRREDDDV